MKFPSVAFTPRRISLNKQTLLEIFDQLSDNFQFTAVRCTKAEKISVLLPSQVLSTNFLERFAGFDSKLWHNRSDVGKIMQELMPLKKTVQKHIYQGKMLESNRLACQNNLIDTFLRALWWKCSQYKSIRWKSAIRHFGNFPVTILTKTSGNQTKSIQDVDFKTEKVYEDSLSSTRKILSLMI